MGFVENINRAATVLTVAFKEAVDTVSTNIGSVVTVSDNIVNVNTTATNIVNVNAVGADLLEPVSEINTVVVNMVDVNTVATNIVDVIAVATDIVPNLAEILLADDNAAIATIKAAEALASANDAAISETNAAASYDAFDDRYLGHKAVEPTLDNDGNALVVGVLYFDTALNAMRVYDGLAWSDALTLTEVSVSTLTNKTIDNISNTIGANHIHYPVRNVSGSTINAGAVVTAHGTQGGTDYIEITPVTDPQTQIALGILHGTVSNNGTGLCMNTGVSTDVINTSGWAVGTILYPNSSGGLTATKPTSGVYQACAVVLRSHATQGTMLIEFTEPKYLASTTLAGYAQLNDTLTSTSTTQALTAAQGKALQDGKADKDATTGALYIGNYTTATRPTIGVNDRVVGYNSTLLSFEGWNGTSWGSLGGGATGGGTDNVFNENEYVVTTNYTIPAGKSAVTVGDASGNVTINSGVTVTLESNSRWVIL